MAAAPPQFAAGRRSAGRDPIAFLFLCLRVFFAKKQDDFVKRL
jgi:hypothetical protein